MAGPPRPSSPFRRRLLALALLATIGAAAYPVARHLRAEYHYRCAERALAADEVDEAGTHLAACLETWPDSGMAHLLAARAARRSNLHDLAAEHLEASRRVLGRIDPVELESALLHFQRDGATPAGEAYLRSVLRRDPSQTDLILEALAQGHMRAYSLVQARACLNEWVGRRPGAVGARLRRGWVQERLENWEAAEDDYRAVLDSHPGHAEAELRLARLLLMEHRGKDAVPHFRNLLARQPGNREVQVGLARCLTEGGENGEARALLDDVLAHHPDDADALLQRGKVALEEGQTEAAEAWLRRAAAVRPHEYTTQFQLLQCLQKAGKKAEAQVLEPRVHALAVDLEEMHRLTNQLQSRPNDPDLRSRIGQIFLRSGEEREGLLWLEGVLRTHPDHAPTRQALAGRKIPGH
jgi:predicted Zn-dependent protease